jgi:hypothetical protein
MPTESTLVPPVQVIDTAQEVLDAHRALIATLREPPDVAARTQIATRYRRAVHRHGRATGQRLHVPGLTGLVRLWG